MAVADLARAVGAPVVYEQQLEVAHRLAEDAFDARVEVFFDLVDRDYDGYQHGWQVRFPVVRDGSSVQTPFGAGWGRRMEQAPVFGRKEPDVLVDAPFAAGAVFADALQVVALVREATFARNLLVVQVEGHGAGT